jgi:prophage tail gpP-like protein
MRARAWQTNSGVFSLRGGVQENEGRKRKRRRRRRRRRRKKKEGRRSIERQRSRGSELWRLSSHLVSRDIVVDVDGAGVEDGELGHGSLQGSVLQRAMAMAKAKAMAMAMAMASSEFLQKKKKKTKKKKKMKKTKKTKKKKKDEVFRSRV